MCVAVVAFSYFTFLFHYFYRFLLSSCVCQLIIKLMMMIMMMMMMSWYPVFMYSVLGVLVPSRQMCPGRANRNLLSAIYDVL